MAAQPRSLGRKVSDEYTVPLCRAHHRELHRAANEIAWWQSRGIAPLAVAQALWENSQSGQALNEPLSPSAKPPAGIKPAEVASSPWRQTCGTAEGGHAEGSEKSPQAAIASPPARTIDPIDANANS